MASATVGLGEFFQLPSRVCLCVAIMYMYIKQELDNEHDHFRFAIAVIKDREVIGHTPQRVGK